VGSQAHVHSDRPSALFEIQSVGDVRKLNRSTLSIEYLIVEMIVVATHVVVTARTEIIRGC